MVLHPLEVLPDGPATNDDPPERSDGVWDQGVAEVGEDSFETGVLDDEAIREEGEALEVGAGEGVESLPPGVVIEVEAGMRGSWINPRGTDPGDPDGVRVVAAVVLVEGTEEDVRTKGGLDLPPQSFVTSGGNNLFVDRLGSGEL